MVIGIPEFRDPAQCATLTGMLALPFRGPLRDAAAGLIPNHDRGLALSNNSKAADRQSGFPAQQQTSNRHLRQPTEASS